MKALLEEAKEMHKSYIDLYLKIEEKVQLKLKEKLKIKKGFVRVEIDDRFKSITTNETGTHIYRIFIHILNDDNTELFFSVYNHKDRIEIIFDSKKRILVLNFIDKHFRYIRNLFEINNTKIIFKPF